MTLSSFRARAKTWLASRRSTPWLTLLGATLTSPSLKTGLAYDDYLHAIPLRGLAVPLPQSGPLDLFRFANGDPHLARIMMDRGQFLWTADPTARFAFFRPLAAATHILDYALWPDAPWLMHAQNIAWYAAGIVGAASVLRRLLGDTWVAGFAVLLFAVDHTHAAAVNWIAGRNALIAVALGLPVLALHDRWRREGWRPGACLAPLLLGAALLAGESAVAIPALLVAYAAHIERGGWKTQILSVAPYAPVLLAWRVAYALLGYGVSGSGMYIDPARSPRAFIDAVAHRLPHLLVGELAFPPSDFSPFYEYFGPSGPALGLLFGLVVLVLFGTAMVPLLRRDPVARFFATGMVLAAVPICSAFSTDRLLLYVSFAGAGLIAQRIALPGGTGAGVASLFLILFHLVVGPPALAVFATAPPYQNFVEPAEAGIPRSPDIASKTVILVNPPNEAYGTYLSSMRTVRGEPQPAFLYELAAVPTEITITRDDPTSLRIRPPNGFLEHEAERFLRAPDRPLLAGTVVQLSRMTVTVTEETSDRRPAEAVFRFDAPLDDASFVWFRWAHGEFVPWIPPPIGATLRLPAFDARRIALDMERERAKR